MNKLKPFLFGIIAASGALIFEMLVSNLYFILSGQDIEVNYFNRITLFLLVVVLLEESAKFIMLEKFYAGEIQKKISGALFAGLGFASVELFFAFSNAALNRTAYPDPGIIGALLLHIATALFIGISIIHGWNGSFARTATTISFAFIWHLSYNLMVIYEQPYVFTYAFLGITYLFLVFLGRRLKPNSA